MPATLTNAGLATQPLVDILAEIRAELALARAELARRHPDHSDWPDGY